MQSQACATRLNCLAFGIENGGNMNSALTQPCAERTVLCISPKQDQDNVAALASVGWHVVHAKSTQQAEKLLERGAIKVGLIELPRECTEQALLKLEACIARSEATWIAQVWPGQAEDELTRRFILDYCFDFVTLPCLDERLLFALGHAHGLSLLRETIVAPAPELGRDEMIGQCE